MGIFRVDFDQFCRHFLFFLRLILNMPLSVAGRLGYSLGNVQKCCQSSCLTSRHKRSWKYKTRVGSVRCLWQSLYSVILGRLTGESYSFSPAFTITNDKRKMNFCLNLSIFANIFVLIPFHYDHQTEKKISSRLHHYLLHTRHFLLLLPVPIVLHA